MTEILSSAQMRAIESAAIESGVTSGLDLMERAGASVIPHLTALPRQENSAVILCGPGNNGGDGFVIARLLHAEGWAVSVFLLGDPDALPADARRNHARWARIGPVQPLSHCRSETLLSAGVVVDALFGTGLTRGLTGDCASLAEAQSGQPDIARRTLAVDIPSGLCADSGRRLGPAFHAGRTVSFHRLKIGHVLADGPDTCGKVEIADIGLSAPCPDAARLVTTPEGLHKSAGHKYHHGHALVLAGGPGRGGAARLAAQGALRIGAGLVTLAPPPAALQENAARLDAVMLHALKDDEALRRVIRDPRITTVCAGPGLGLGARESGLISVLLERHGAEQKQPALVLDADALTVLAQNPGLVRKLRRNCILTPHAGEFARLFPDIAGKLAAAAQHGPAYSKLDATRAAAAQAGCVIVFKGPDTVIATPSGQVVIHAAAYDRAAPWLATAGSGDVLAGFITGLLARGHEPLAAAASATWLHTEAARNFGPGLIAEDLPRNLPQVLRAVGA